MSLLIRNISRNAFTSHSVPVHSQLSQPFHATQILSHSKGTQSTTMCNLTHFTLSSFNATQPTMKHSHGRHQIRNFSSDLPYQIHNLNKEAEKILERLMDRMDDLEVTKMFYEKALTAPTEHPCSNPHERQAILEARIRTIDSKLVSIRRDISIITQGLPK